MSKKSIYDKILEEFDKTLKSMTDEEKVAYLQSFGFAVYSKNKVDNTQKNSTSNNQKEEVKIDNSIKEVSTKQNVYDKILEEFDKTLKSMTDEEKVAYLQSFGFAVKNVNKKNNEESEETL